MGLSFNLVSFLGLAAATLIQSVRSLTFSGITAVRLKTP